MRRLFPLVLAFTLLFVGVPFISARDTISVYYAGPQGGARTALSLAENFEIVADPSQADVLLLNGVIPDPERVAARVRAGAGLVLILGPALTAPEVEALWRLCSRLSSTMRILSSRSGRTSITSSITSPRRPEGARLCPLTSAPPRSPRPAHWLRNG